MNADGIRRALGIDKMEDRVRALAHAMVTNEVDVCGIGIAGAGRAAHAVLAALNAEGYDIVSTAVGDEKSEVK